MPVEEVKARIMKAITAQIIALIVYLFAKESFWYLLCSFWSQSVILIPVASLRKELPSFKREATSY